MVLTVMKKFHESFGIAVVKQVPLPPWAIRSHHVYGLWIRGVQGLDSRVTLSADRRVNIDRGPKLIFRAGIDISQARRYALREMTEL